MLGYSVILTGGNLLKILEVDSVRFSSSAGPYQRLEMIQQLISKLILQHHPQQLAIEAPFFGKNVQSMLKLGRAQGVAIAAAIQGGLEICEYSPRKIKQSITGNGNASKEQVLKMLETITGHSLDAGNFDASDALAVAVCHHFQHNSLFIKSSVKVKDWKEFLSQNPGKLM